MTGIIQGKPIEILLVEDNPPDAELTREALKEGKVAVHLSHVEDGVEAMDFLARRGRYASAPRPELILLDLNMPRKDGREVLAELKRDPSLRSIPVIVLTTSSADQDILRSYELHANCYITKPVDFERFQGIVRLIEQFWLTVAALPGRP